ncbi:MAG TPA: TonB-dependent receptor [Parapedobacter sp.]|nr:TonB-dependent receptor [Parapedobacter sp.]
MKRRKDNCFVAMLNSHGDNFWHRLTICLIWVLLPISIAFAQIRVTGTTTDGSTGEKLPYIVVQVKGTAISTATDIAGNYSVEVPSQDAVLAFSYIGYEKVEVAVGNQTRIDVSLYEDVALLDEVVVVGYGVQNKRDVTGSIAKIDGDALMVNPGSSFDAAMQGRAPGVQVTQTSGMAGAGAAIRVRGIASITAGGDPLIVIDGIPIQQDAGGTTGAAQDNPLASVNTNDIQSIDILKDASATAIYGSRGANGVILITTKRGSSGRPKISLSTRVPFASPNVKVDMLETKDYLMLYREALENDFRFNPNTTDPATVSTYPRGFTEDQALTTNTDWQDLVTRTGVSAYNDLSISFGNNQLRSYIGLSHAGENSYIVDNHFNRTSGRLNLDYSPTQFLTLGGNFSFSHTYNRYVPVSWDGGYGRAISAALPYFPAYNEDGSYFVFPMSTNPVTEIKEKRRRIYTDRTMGSLFADVKLVKDLSLRLEGNLDYRDSESNYLRTQALSTAPNSNMTNRYDTNWNAKALLNYALKLSDDHRFHFLVGTEALRSKSTSNYRNVVFVAGEEDWLYNNPTYDPERETATIYPNQEYSFISFFGRINYTLKERYMLTATYRRDGSSRFGANNKFGDFPAVSVGWLLSEEEFLKGNDVVSLLKLKTGYGITGNAEIPNYAQWGAVSINETQLYMGQNYWYINSLKNPNLKWETTHTFDVGLEYGFFNGRISGEIGFYDKNSQDLFLNVRVPASGGYSSFLGNIGKVRNSGVEFNIRSANVSRSNFSWTTDFNISYNKNKVLDVGTAGPDALGGQGDTRVLVGQPIGVNYLVKTIGVDPEDGAPIFEMLDADKKPVGQTKEYNAERDRQPVGHPYSDFVGGLNNRLSHKNWDFGFMFTFQIGGSIYDDGEKFQMNNMGTWNLKSKVLDRWQKPGDMTDVPRMTLGNSGINQARNTTEYLHDAGFLRLKNINLGYSLKGEFMNRLRIQDIRIYGQATNLLTLFNEYFSKYSGEPEIMRDVTSAQARNLSLNVTYLTPPQARTYTIGLNVNF